MVRICFSRSPGVRFTGFGKHESRTVPLSELTYEQLYIYSYEMLAIDGTTCPDSFWRRRWSTLRNINGAKSAFIDQ